MKTKRFWSFIITLAMLMTTISSFAIVHAADEPTDYYYVAAHKTTGAKDYLNVDLDKIFKTGEKYKITFNAKPDDASSSVFNKLGVFLNGGDISFAKETDRRLVYLYEDNGFHGMGMNNWNNIGYIQGYRDNVQKMGVDIEMIWDTEAGTVDFTVLLPESGYSDRTKTYKWTPGKVTGEYGKLSIGAESTAVAIRDLRIKNVNALSDDSYTLESYQTICDGDKFKVDLDGVFNTDETYELTWNMKPSVYAGSCARADVVDGDVKPLNASGQNFGLFNIHEENGTNQALGLGNWYNIGNVTAYKDAVLQNGINMKVVWNTETGHVAISVDFGGQKTYTYSWEPGVISGKYGKLAIGANDATMAIKDLKIVNVTPVKTEKYYVASHKTTGAKDYLNVDLDKIFKKGEKYKITFNAKPDDTSAAISNKLAVFLNGGDISFADDRDRRLVYLYEENGGFHGLGMNTWSNIGYIQGYRGNIQKMGVDIEMIWDTEAGTVDFTVLLPESGYSDRTKTYKWTPGKVTGEYGKLSIGAESTAVAIRDLRIKNVKASPDDSYTLEAYQTICDGDKFKVDLDSIFNTGKTYELTWNMKPNVYAGTCANVDIVDGDIVIQNSIGQKRGLLFVYEENGNNHAMGLGNWYNIGNVTAYKDAVLQNGINMKLVWNTEVGHAEISADFGGQRTYIYSWEPGVVSGKYGKLSIGAEAATMTISNLSIQEKTTKDAPVLTADSIKIFADEVEQSAADAGIDTNKIVVDFGQSMYEEDMTDSKIYVVDKETGSTINGNLVYAEGVCTITYDNKFTPGKTYTVTVLKVRNVDEQLTAEEYRKDFTILKNGIHADLVSVVQNGTEIKLAKDLSVGDATININYSNTTDSAPVLQVIAAYYSGEKLVHADIIEQATTIGQTTADFPVKYTVPTVSETYDKVKFMVWDGLNTLVPLSDTIILQ